MLRKFVSGVGVVNRGEDSLDSSKGDPTLVPLYVRIIYALFRSRNHTWWSVRFMRSRIQMLIIIVARDLYDIIRTIDVT